MMLQKLAPQLEKLHFHFGARNGHCFLPFTAEEAEQHKKTKSVNDVLLEIAHKDPAFDRDLQMFQDVEKPEVTDHRMLAMLSVPVKSSGPTSMSEALAIKSEVEESQILEKIGEPVRVPGLQKIIEKEIAKETGSFNPSAITANIPCSIAWENYQWSARYI